MKISRFLLVLLTSTIPLMSYGQDNKLSLSGYVHTINAVTTGCGTDAIGLTIADSLHLFAIDYAIDYRYINKVRSTLDIGYTDDWQEHYRGTKMFTREQHNFNALYAYELQRNLFVAQLTGHIAPSRERGTRQGTIAFAIDDIYGGTGVSQLSSRDDDIALNIYDQYSFSMDKHLSISLVNTLANAYSSSLRTLIDDDYGEEFAINARTNDHLYAFCGEVAYEAPLFAGHVNIASRYEYKHLRQTYEQHRECPTTHYEALTATYAQAWHSVCSLWATAGADLIAVATPTHTTTYLLPDVTLRTAFTPQKRAQGLTIDLAARMTAVTPSVGDLVTGRSFFDPWLYATGNSNLKPYWLIAGQIRISYTTRDDLLSLHLAVTPQYASDHYATAVIKDSPYTILRPANMGGRTDCNIMLSVGVKPLGCLTIEPYIEYAYAHYKTPVSNIHFNYVRAGGTIAAQIQQWTLSATVASPMKRQDSNLISYTGWAATGRVTYALHAWTLGAEYSYAGHNSYIFANTANLRYNDTCDWQHLHNNLAIIANYSFSLGPQHKHHLNPHSTTLTPASTTLHNPATTPHNPATTTTNDAGLTRFNTPKSPK